MIILRLLERFKQANERLILLDYDGSLVKHESLPELAMPNERLFAILMKLINLTRTKVWIVTGRSQTDIDRLFGQLPVDIIAEHGAMKKEKEKWESQTVEQNFMKTNILPLFRRMELTCPKSFIEEKKYSIAWHFRNSDSVLGLTRSKELIYSLENQKHFFNFKILIGNKVIEVLPEGIDKGNAVKKIIEKNNYDFILSIGDDKTDEDMFEVLAKNDKAFTFKVGDGKTLAKHRLKDVVEVINLLDQFQ